MDYPPYFHDLTIQVPDSFYQPIYLLLSSLAYCLQYSQPIVDSLPLHAPIPLPLQPSMLCTMDQPLTGMDSVTFCEPHQQPHVYCSNDIIQFTFPTPSELLAELAANGLPAISDEFGSDDQSESACKAPWLKVWDLFQPTHQAHIHPVLYPIEN